MTTSLTRSAPAPVPPGDGGPPLDHAAFDALYDRLRAWDRPAPPDGHVPYGAFGAVGPEQRRQAVALVRTGEVVSLALPVNRHPAPDNTRPAQHHMVDTGDQEGPEPTANKDFLGLDYDGKAVTHLDALCHIAYRGQLHGGVTSRDVVGSGGSSHYPVADLADGLVLRGVLLDVAASRGVPWLEPGEAVLADELRSVAQEEGLDLAPGDAVLLRSGHVARREALGPWDPDRASAGLHPSALGLLAETGTSLLGGDGDSDVRPSPVQGVSSPVHVLALTALGIPLLDNLDLERLSSACAARRVWEFLLVVAPLVVPGGTGSPVNPLAVL